MTLWLSYLSGVYIQVTHSLWQFSTTHRADTECSFLDAYIL